ncbi:unnamed protein product [Angiostrongylus costaricensis]|uniref:Transmembrane protein n=1 Tax=Angiostrongylus costaricensis TaxID=334426 RepID=A0A0R3Q194_ANGCS|nr:unnamed protein product [Angiostrongylus costaricensis]
MRTDDCDMMDLPVSGVDEIEAELLPSAALLREQCNEELSSSRYIRTKHDTTMEHLAELIHLRVMEEVQSNQSDFDADPVPSLSLNISTFLVAITIIIFGKFFARNNANSTKCNNSR